MFLENEQKKNDRLNSKRYVCKSVPQKKEKLTVVIIET